ncbi:MAG: endonuclease/exonuclease/phosphatase family protein [Melioribacteraceae bacterium]|nr:endonuclease/exonuclease/phosphatase family protein [Melioribacteraceae bacterium]
MSYNIRLDIASDGINKWDNRKEELIDQLEAYEPDFLGIQEGLHHQVLYLDSSLSDYGYIGIGRENGLTKGEYCAIFYKKEKFSVISDSTIWLSENPTSVSVGWDAAMERICTCCLFMDIESGQKIWIFNSHYDHIGAGARENSSKLILEHINNLNNKNFPTILMGDFNSVPKSKPIEIITAKFDDAYSVSVLDPVGPPGTFTGFREDAPLLDRIDYIFVKGFKVLSVSHLNEMRHDGNFLSDHLPVFVKIELLD